MLPGVKVAIYRKPEVISKFRKPMVSSVPEFAGTISSPIQIYSHRGHQRSCHRFLNDYDLTFQVYDLE